MRRNKAIWLIGLILVAVAVLITAGVSYRGHIDKLPFLAYGESSIGLYAGNSPFGLTPAAQVSNPILQADEVSDVSARQLSHPFMVNHHGLWYMFFKVTQARSNQGDIGFATSGNGYYWNYQRVVLDEFFDLSYPCVFDWKGEYYMIPQSNEVGVVYLYKATSFPSEWTRLATIIHQKGIAPTFFVNRDTCWLFLGSEDHSTLRLFFATDVVGPWTEHPKSPVISSDRHAATPAGRVIEYKGDLYRFALDCEPVYGNCIRVFEIDELSGASYRESEISLSPMLFGSGEGWNADWIHHIDPHQLDDSTWTACLDGGRNVLQIGLKY